MNIKMVYSFIFKWLPEGLLMFYCFFFFPFVFVFFPVRGNVATGRSLQLSVRRRAVKLCAHGGCARCRPSSWV